MVDIKYDKQSNDNYLMTIYLSFLRNVIVQMYIVFLRRISYMSNFRIFS